MLPFFRVCARCFSLSASFVFLMAVTAVAWPRGGIGALGLRTEGGRRREPRSENEMRGKRQTRKKGTSEGGDTRKANGQKNHSGACSSRIPVPESSLGASRHRDDSSLRVEARKTARERKRKPASGAVDLASLSFSTPPEKGNAFQRPLPLPASFLSFFPSLEPLSLSLLDLSLPPPCSLSCTPHPTAHPHPRSSPSWPSPSPRPSSSATRRGGRSGSRRTLSAARPRRTCFARSTSSRTSSRSRGRSTTGSCRSRPTAR